MYSHVLLFGKRYVKYVFGKKIYVAHNVHQLLFRTKFLALTKFIMPNGSHMDAHKIYDLTVVFCSAEFSTRGPALLQAPRSLNPALNETTDRTKFIAKWNNSGKNQKTI